MPEAHLLFFGEFAVSIIFSASSHYFPVEVRFLQMWKFGFSLCGSSVHLFILRKGKQYNVHLLSEYTFLIPEVRTATYKLELSVKHCCMGITSLMLLKIITCTVGSRSFSLFIYSFHFVVAGLSAKYILLWPFYYHKFCNHALGR